MAQSRTCWAITLRLRSGQALGSTAIVANSSGGLSAEQRYKPWGEQRYPGGASTLPTRYQFTGQRNDVEIGLYFYNARYYSSLLGRFVSADTIVPKAGNPQAFNRYAYVVNNPLKYNDPSGHCFIFCAVVGAAIGAIFGGVASTVSQVVQDIQAGEPLSIDGGQVLQAVGAGAVTGAVGGATFGVGLAVGGAIAGTAGVTGGTAASVAGAATVAASSVASGQAVLATENLMAGRDLGSGLFQPGDMVKDAVLGLVGFKLLKGKFDQIPMSNMLRNASTGKGNFGVGEATSEQANTLGNAWVGNGARMSSSGKAMVSQDGLRQFRPPSFKPKLGISQANLEQRSISSGRWQSNAHIDIIP